VVGGDRRTFVAFHDNPYLRSDAFVNQLWTAVSLLRCSGEMPLPRGNSCDAILRSPRFEGLLLVGRSGKVLLIHPRALVLSYAR